MVFKGEQNKWSSLWVDKVVPWTERCPEEISDKMDLPDEYARIVVWARAEHDWLRRFDEKGEYMVRVRGLREKSGSSPWSLTGWSEALACPVTRLEGNQHM